MRRLSVRVGRPQTLTKTGVHAVRSTENSLTTPNARERERWVSRMEAVELGPRIHGVWSLQCVVHEARGK